ncbi:MAG: penicillin-binding protein 2 [Microbacteriaceae bacterium]|nr:penicillin-binding protein 2 [Microbacteriaceae bacterium]
MDARGSRRRMAFALLVVAVVVGAFAIRLVDLQIVQAAELTASAEQRRTIPVTTYGVRGSIVDSDGEVLADSVERFDITASPKNAKLDETWMTVDGERVKVPTAQAIQAIADLTGADPNELYRTLAENRDSDFAYLAKKVTLEVFTKVRDLGIPWVYSELHPARTYPSGAIAGNLVGFIGTDGPQAGIEIQQDECLAATNGKSTYESSADGVRLPGSTVVEQEAKDGGTIHLTIDADLQWYAQQVVAEYGTSLGADSGSAMIVEVATGRIMAAADWPSVDPNDVDGVGVGDLGARVFSTPFEPGSVIKVATFASLLDAGKISPRTELTVPGVYTEGLPEGSSIKDSWAHGDLRLTATGVLVNSSNIGTAMLSTRLGLEKRRAYLEAFGFNSDTAVDFYGESSGRVLPMNELDPLTGLTQQFGQGMSATSAQVAALYQTIGNGGVRMPLTLVDGCEWPDGTWTQRPSTEGIRVVSQAAADTTVQMMEVTAQEGFIKNMVAIPGYRVAVKTGTAEVAENGVYGSQRIVSVAGLVPAGDPQYAIVVTFVKPDTMRTSAAAAPAFAAIAKQVIKTFRITPQTKGAPSIPTTW